MKKKKKSKDWLGTIYGFDLSASHKILAKALAAEERKRRMEICRVMKYSMAASGPSYYFFFLGISNYILILEKKSHTN